MTQPSVKRIDRIARLVITTGGLGTIVAVTLIVVFLTAVALPLFGGASVEGPVAATAAGLEPVLTGIDELQLISWALLRDGRIRLFRADTGESLDERRAFEGELTAWFMGADGASVSLGFADGTVRDGRIGFASTFLERADMPEELKGLRKGERERFRDGMVVVTPEGQFRLQTLDLALQEPFEAADSAVAAIDHTVTPSGGAWVVVGSSGGLRAFSEEVATDMMTGERVATRAEFAVPYAHDAARGRPVFAGLSGIGTSLFVLWEDGLLVRYDTRDQAALVEAERQRLLGDGARVTAVSFVIGKNTLFVGDSLGGLQGFFLIKPPDGGTVDGAVLVAAHRIEPRGSPVTALAPSSRGRTLAVGYADGAARIVQTTLDDVVLEVRAGRSAVRSLRIAPKEDGLVVASAEGLSRWQCNLGFPSGSLRALLAPVWYEGYDEPDTVWQSVGGTDDFESKFGLVPLILGTLKATFYSMLIALPLGLLAAVFTTEFLGSRLRTPTKSCIEMMASLPSVVLGFVAAQIIAPRMQYFVPAMLACLATLPASVLLGSRLWQFLPSALAQKWSGWPRIAAMAAFVALGIAAGALAGPPFEEEYFGGDIREWLAGYGSGGPEGGWMFLLLPFCALVVVVSWSAFGTTFVRTLSASWSRRQCAAFDLAKYVGLLLVVFGLTWLLAHWFGREWDPRGGIVGTYVPRNALVVGFVMGFAVVPIIYTLAEDALSSVPSSLREGSLAAGATPWQTAWRIVIPASMSGLFGAVMVGLGRAVGETMIVLMAAGNTPIKDWNMFNGFRTLSANIAVELPEASAGSVHYRVLFFAALVLFAMTFAVNTVAELVRRAVRRRYSQL